MLKRILPVLLALLCLVSKNLSAQAPPCGFDKANTELLKSNPEYARTVKANSLALKKYIQSHPELLKPSSTSRSGATYVIPVVVHVMHTGGAVGTIYNPADAQILGAIDYLNDVYAGIYPGMTSPSAGGAAGNIDIQFALAQRTPSCGATNGIDRVDASGITDYTAFGVERSSANGCPDMTLKNLARWTPANYYNIWVVNKIDGADGTSGQFIAGYAYLAGAPANLDGTVMLATQMVSGEKTLPHEIGHALNLYHPFNNSTPGTPCVLGDCTSTGDNICDTDPISENVSGGTYDFTCRTGTNICTGTPYMANTESNFMSYTDCYTLFTNGQAAMMRACFSLPSRSSLVASTNLSLIPCGTAINFVQSTDVQKEDSTATLNGCRRYKDYTYQIGIGANPSATATITFTYGGTATRGIDYDLTTNGSFSSPSNTITFPSGAASIKILMVRVYDDASVESTESATIDFTLNNGGGNATKGTNSPTLSISLADNDVAPSSALTGSFQIGGTPIYYMTQAPFDARLQVQRSQMLYKASELIAAGIQAGKITQFALFVNTKGTSRNFTNFNIRMANDSRPNLVDGAFPAAVTGLVNVYNSAAYTTVAGINNFVLSAPFHWDGTSSLIIDICYDNLTADATKGADEIRYYSDGSAASIGNMIYQNNIGCAVDFNSITYFSGGRKPIIQLTYVIGATQIETQVSGSTSSSYEDVGSNDYNYSSNGRLLTRLSGINSQLGCVSTSLDAAGTTWPSFMGGQRSSKVFAVTPTTNGSTAGYTIDLYFDNAELAGKNPATLRIAKTSASSPAGATSGNTVIVTPTVSTLGSSTTIFSGNFTGFSRFFLIDPAVTLPVNLLSFTGNIDAAGDHVIEWQTATELNNKEFRLELSTDGTTFKDLATIPSQGNSNSVQRYEYVRHQPQQGNAWYRLKQVDMDGQIKYSKIIVLSSTANNAKPFLYPVPARESITLNFGKSVNTAELQIFTADMKVVKQIKLTGLTTTKEVSISDLRPGVYFIKIKENREQTLLRFFKE